MHYCLVEIEGRVTDESPVVMCVPMMGAKGTIVVGENLRDFLCLGCEVGYFWLEQLVYRRAETIGRIARGANAPVDGSVEEELLRLLKSEFELKPWVEIESHLDELQKRYIHRLESPRING